MSINMNTMIKAVLFTAGVLLSGLAAADLTGTWNLTVETPQGTGNPSFTLVEEAGKLTGTYNGMMGSSPVTGSVEDGDFKISFTVDAQGQSLNIDYSGMLNDDGTIAGKMNMGGFAEGSFTGKKQ